jgi:O-Antigen ligase
MFTILIILCALIWSLIAFSQIIQRAFLALLIILLIAPVATNMVKGQINPFSFTSEQKREVEVGFYEHQTRYFNEEATITAKEFFEPARIFFCLLFIYFLLDTLSQRKSLAPLNKTEIWMGLFSIIVISNALLLSSRVASSLRVATDAFIVPFLAYYVTRRLVTNEERFRQLVRMLGYLGFYLILLCLIERLSVSRVLHRLNGPFTSGQVLHVVLAIAFFVALLDSIYNTQHLWGRQALPAGVRKFVLYLSPVIIFLTWSRGNLVGFLIGIWAFLFLGRRMINTRWKFGALGLILTLIPLIVTSTVDLAPQEVTEGRIANVSTMHIRLRTWGVVIQEFPTNKIIFGIGLNNLRYFLAEKWQGSSRLLLTIHNSYLAIVFEQGIIGLTIYLLMVASIIQMGLKLYQNSTHPRIKWLGIAVIAIMLDYLVPALFDNTLYLSDLAHIYVYVTIGGIAGLYTLHPSDSYFYAVHRDPWRMIANKPSSRMTLFTLHEG